MRQKHTEQGHKVSGGTIPQPFRLRSFHKQRGAVQVAEPCRPCAGAMGPSRPKAKAASKAKPKPAKTSAKKKPKEKTSAKKKPKEGRAQASQAEAAEASTDAADGGRRPKKQPLSLAEARALAEGKAALAKAAADAKLAKEMADAEQRAAKAEAAAEAKAMKAAKLRKQLAQKTRKPTTETEPIVELEETSSQRIYPAAAYAGLCLATDFPIHTCPVSKPDEPHVPELCVPATYLDNITKRMVDHNLSSMSRRALLDFLLETKPLPVASVCAGTDCPRMVCKVQCQQKTVKAP